MTLLVIAIALALPAGLYVAMENLHQLGGEIRTSARMTVFLKRDTGPDAARAAMAEFRQLAGIESLTYVSREQALAEFEELSGFGDILDSLEQNPLPPVVLVQFDSHVRADPQALTALAAGLAEHPRVDDVAVDRLWLQRLQALLETGRDLAYALGALLGLGVLLVMGNTIRLAIENRRDEILVVKLVGGTDSYVRRPFLYTGLWYGIGGGLLAWLLVLGGLMWMQGAIERVAGLYQLGFALSGPGVEGFFILLLAGGGLGLAGAWLAVAQHARRIEPR
jgi:cell division transport system permease protein